MQFNLFSLFVLTTVAAMALAAVSANSSSTTIVCGRTIAKICESSSLLARFDNVAAMAPIAMAA